MPATTSSPSSTQSPAASVLAPIDDNQQSFASEPSKADGTSTSTLTTSARLAPAVRKHKSVKSITREYEFQQTTTTSAAAAAAAASTSTYLSLPFASSHALDGGSPSSSSPLFLTQQRRASSESSPSSSPSGSVKSHTRRASVLLASASYPSTLSTAESVQHNRPRTVSNSSISAKDQNRSPSLRLASAAYPSSYQTYTRSPRSSSGTSPLPLPTVMGSEIMSSQSAADTSSASLPMLNVSLTEDDANVQEASQESGEEGDMVAELSPSPTSKKQLSQMTAAERREHSRKHSRVHSRNLSIFFPRPGTDAEREADDAQAASQFDKPRVTVQTVGLVSAEEEGLTVPSSSSGVSVSPSKSNRGHHRKHSVNHTLLATTRSTANKEASDTGSFSSPGAIDDDEKHMREDLGESPTIAQALSTPLWQSETLTSLPASHRPLLVFGALHFVLGAMLWTKGQSGDSLSLTGLGYLVVFDAFGILNGVASEWLTHGWKRLGGSKQTRQTIRKPYGPHRVETVLQFSQTIFLLFASIYVCKESVEHALLEGAEGHHEEDDVGLVLPWLLLALTTAACLFSNMVLQTHDKLVAACGIATTASDSGSNKRRTARGHGRANSILVDPSTLAGPFLHLFSNPFSITVLFFCITLTSAALVMPPFQVAALDKVLAGLESVAMLYIAYPASKALGKILLQTAPKSFNTQNVQLLRSLKTIEEHHLVTYVAPPHLWQLTPPTSALNSSQYGKGNGALLGSQRLAKNASLIATVEVFLKEDASDASVLEVTKWAWTLLAPAVGAGAGLQAGESLRGAIRAGEITVQVSREGQRDLYRQKQQASHHHHHHGHDHDHHNHHDHAQHDDHDHHNHHDHAHHDNHDHNHSHGHTHAQADHSHHSHSQSPTHTYDSHSQHHTGIPGGHAHSH